MFSTKSSSKDENKEKEEMKWVPDHKHKECMLCNRQFSMLNRRHHCRQCGCLVCSNCSKNKWYITQNDSNNNNNNNNNNNKYERVCDSCFNILSNNKPIIINSDPYLQILTEPNLYSWLMTFEKSWIRSRYPNQFNTLKKQLLQKNENKKKLKPTKPPNANIVSKLTPHAIGKKIAENKEKNNNNNKKKNAIKPIYRRPQKQKYQCKKIESDKKTVITKPKSKAKAKQIKSKSKIKYNPLIVVQTGLLYLNIMEALGLPDCDRFSSPDGYCIYYVTNNDPCFGETTKYSTKVQHNTYSPQWNEDETIIITNTTGKLIIELWDYDFGADDDYLGRVEIQLCDLFLHFSCQQPLHSIIDDWFEVHLSKQWTNKKRKLKQNSKPNNNNNNNNNNRVYINPHCGKLLRQKYNNTSRLLQIPNDDHEFDMNNLQITPVYKRIETMPTLSIHDTFNEDIINGKCFIHLQLKLKASWWGHFISYFDPLLPPPPKKIPFDMNIFYAEINKLLLYVYPIMDESQSFMDVLFWVKYIWAIIYLFMYMYCIFYPWFAVFCFQYRLLIFICHSYVKQTVLSENSLNSLSKFNLPIWLHYLVVFFGVIPTIFNTVSNKNKELRNQNKNDSNDENKNKNKNKNENKNKNKNKKEEIMNVNDQNELKEEKTEEETNISMGAFTTLIGNNAIKVSGLKDNIVWYQELLIWINQTIDYILKLFNWTYVSITSSIVIGLIISCLLLIIFRNTSFYKYQLLIIGAAILSFFSKPMQFLLWLYLGSSNWYYKYYTKYKDFKIQINASPKYDEYDYLDFDDHDSISDHDKNRNQQMINDMGIIKQYVFILWHKIKIISQLCYDLIFGIVELLRPIFDISNNKKTKKPILNRHHTHPTTKSKKPLLKRMSDTFKSAPIYETNRDNNNNKNNSSRHAYLSADALSIGSGRSVKSKHEVDRILKQRKYSNDSKKKKIKKIGTMFGFGSADSGDDGYVQQKNRENKQKNKNKKLRKAQTMKRQPTLLRKTTLKKIETTADSKINSMMQKLSQAKSAYSVV